MLLLQRDRICYQTKHADITAKEVEGIKKEKLDLS